MKIEKTNIEGLLVIHPTVFKDDRGYFFESFNQKKFNELSGFDYNFVQDNQSLSSKNVLRGLHFQNPPFAQAKLVRVTRGSVMDVAVDLRKNSNTYGRYFSIILSGENNIALFIPEGFAHGFVTLEDNTLFIYKCSNYYNKESESTINWNDPSIHINWNCSSPIISEKDAKGISFNSFSSPF